MNDRLLLILLLCAAAALVILLVLLSRRDQFPRGEVVSQDLTDAWKPAAVLRSETYGISGKPDLLLRDGDQLVPVELKSYNAPADPYASNLMQLAAYFLLIEENYDARPDYSIIQYADEAVRVENSGSLRKQLLRTTSRMREWDGSLPPRCGRRGQCAGCGYRDSCGITVTRDR